MRHQLLVEIVILLSFEEGKALLMKRIGFVGVGVMGSGMVCNLLKSGFEVCVYTRTKTKAAEVIEAGAVWSNSIAECVANCDYVITMVGFPEDVAEVYFGATDAGIIDSAKEGTYLIDMTTTSPRLSACIYTKALQKKLHALDAPVSGGDLGARNATLSIMVGGDKADFDICMPVFEALGKNIVYQGKAGSGQNTKMANQIALAGAIAGVCEAIAYAKKSGLDPTTVLESIGKGAAGSWQMTNMAPKIIEKDFAPGFYIKHYNKDMSIALEEAKENGLNLNILKTVYGMYRELESNGNGELGTQALMKAFE